MNDIMNKKNVLIAGCGDVGCELARQLLADGGFSVWGLRRSVEKLPEGVHPVAGDLFDPDNLGQWPEKIDYLVYSAATDGRGEENYRKAYVNGLSNVLARIQNEGYLPERILFTSSTSVYSQGNGEEISESTIPAPASYTGLTMLEAESLIIASPYPATAVRFGGIYGPGRNRMINRVKAGEGCPAAPVIYGNRIHRDDCAGILGHLIKRDMEGLSVDTLYLGVDNHPAPMYDVLHWLAEQLDVVLDDSHPSPARANKRCKNHRIVDAGYSFRFPDYKAGYKNLITG